MTSIKNDLKQDIIPSDRLSEIRFFFCDYTNDTHCKRLVELIGQYMNDPMGESNQVTGVKTADLLAGLANHPSSFVLFIQYRNNIIGLATCFINFSTFRSKRYINIHDIFIEKPNRGKGFGKALMNEIISLARLRNYCKVNLEVREDNLSAKTLYQSLGFHDTKPAMHFWTKYL
jgi:ribosomal protein S18 acetylase RimI-like enzyme